MNLDKNEMFGTRKTDHSRKAAGEAESWQPIMPVPDSAPLSVFPPGEIPDAAWTYSDAAGNRLFHVARFDRPGGKIVMPRSYGTLNGVTGWHWKGPPEPRPLYGLHALASRPDHPVLVVEGEKAADAAQKLFLDRVVITSPNGHASADKADWSNLRGRRVVIWPDHDGPGLRYASDVARHAHAAGAISVAVVQVPECFPEKWDLADACPPGFDAPALERLLRTARVVEPEPGNGRQRASPDEGPVSEPSKSTRGRREDTGAEKAEEEPLPLMRELSPESPFPVVALGTILGPAALAIQERTGAPDSMCASSVLAAAALCVQPHVDVILPTGAVRPVSNDFITIGVSGERKSTVDKLALAAAYAYEARHEPGYRTSMRGYLDDLETWEALRTKAKRKSALTMASLRSALAGIGPPPEEPLDTMLLVPEPTYEGLVKLLARGRGSLGLFADEGGLFIGGHGMTAEAKLRTVAGLSDAWDGKPIKRIRVGEKSLSLRGRRLSMHLMAQPSVADILLTDPLINGQGLLSRILIAAPASTMGSRAGAKGSPAGEAALNAYDGCLERLLEQPWPGTRGELSPRQLSLSAEATELWQSFADAVENRLAPNGPFMPIAGLANKLAEHAARLAAVRTIVENPAAPRVEAGHLESGITIAKFYADEALRLMEAGKGDPELRLAQKLLHWLRWTWDEPLVSLPDIYQRGLSAIGDKATATRMVKLLVDHRWLTDAGEAVVRGKPRRQAWNIRRWRKAD